MENFKKSLFLHQLTHKVGSSSINGELTSVGPVDVKDERSKAIKRFDKIADKITIVIFGILMLPFALPLAILQSLGIAFSYFYDVISGEAFRKNKQKIQ